MQGEGKEMGVVRDICCAQSSSPCSWGDLKREWGGWGGSPQHCSEQLCLGRGISLSLGWPESSCVLAASLGELLLLSLTSLALSFPTPISAEKIHQGAVGLFCYTKQVYSASTATSICALLNFFPTFFLCHAALIQIPQRGEQRILYFKISSADFEKLSLNIL